MLGLVPSDAVDMLAEHAAPLHRCWAGAVVLGPDAWLDTRDLLFRFCSVAHRAELALTKAKLFDRAVIKLDSRALSYGGAVYKDVHCRQPDKDVRFAGHPALPEASS